MAAAALLLSACYSYICLDCYAARFESYDGLTDEMTVQVTECEYSLPYASAYTAVVRSAGQLPRGTKIRLILNTGAVEEGTILSGEAELHSLTSVSTANYDARRTYLPKRIMLEAEDVSLSVTDYEPVRGIGAFFRRINARLTAWITAHTDSESGGLAAAFLLGNRQSLSDAAKRDFRRIGISHLLVISGTHFAVILGIFQYIFQHTMLHRRWRALICIVFIVFFMGLTGFSASVTRAAIMQLVAQLGLILFKKSNSFHFLTLAGFLMILINPFWALDAGMQFSFVASATCLQYQSKHSLLHLRLPYKKQMPRARKIIRRYVNRFFDTFLLTLLNTLNMLPICCLYYGEFSLISVFSNVIFVPLVTVMIYLAAAYLVLYPIRLLIVPLAALINLLGSLILKLAGVFADLPYSLISIDYSFSYYFLIPLTVLLFLIPLFKDRQKRKRVAVCAVSVCLLFLGTVAVVRCADRTNVYITYEAQNKNEGLVLKAENKALICDVSSGAYTSLSLLTHEAHDLHVSEIDGYLFTHYHSKHLQQFSRLCEREIVRSVYLPEPVNEKEEAIYNALIELANRYGLRLVFLPSGGTFDYNGTSVTLFKRTYLSRSTHPITAIGIKAYDVDTVLLGGSFNESDPSLMAAAESAECLLFGRHSPIYKKTFGFLREEVPKIMAVCTDAYEHMDETWQSFCLDHAWIDPVAVRLIITENGVTATAEE